MTALKAEPGTNLLESSKDSLPLLSPLPARPGGEPTKTHCPYCALQCGTLLTRTNDQIHIEGDPSFPVNNGLLCLKGWTAGELIQHPERILTPLVRGANGGLHSATWEEALDRVADALQATRATHGANALGVFGSGALTHEKAYLLGKFARIALGTSNIDYNGRYCMSSAAAAQNKAFGIDRGLPFPLADIEQAKTLFLVGANPFDTLPPMSQWFRRQKANGGRLIVADPRRTPTASEASIHLALRPGSDLALANGLLFIALEERLIDESFLRQRTHGFDEVRRIALGYFPAMVEKMTGIAEPVLRQVARALAGPEPSLILTGRGPEQQSKGVDTVLAFINLALALGQVGRPGGGFGTLTGQGNGQGGREHGQKADQLPGYRLIEVDADRAHVAKVWGIDPARIPRKGKSAYELLDSIGRPDGVRNLLVMGSNIAVASPFAARIQERLESLDFLVVADPFLNETAQLADVILPVTQWAEEEGTMTNLEGRVIRRRRAIDPPEGVRSDLEILSQLAARLGEGERFAYASAQEVFNELRLASAGGTADYAGITYERIEREGGVFWPCPAEDGPDSPRLFAQRFFHADGKARLHPVEHRAAAEEPDADYPIYLTTGRYMEHYNSGAQTRRVSKLLTAKPQPRLELHPELAARHGISSGDLVLVKSRRAEVQFEAHLSRTIRSDTVFAPFHWGGKAAANLLTNPALDPTSRMPEFKFVAVCLARVTAEEKKQASSPASMGSRNP